VAKGPKTTVVRSKILTPERGPEEDSMMQMLGQVKLGG
jgi:hypothetical protein